VLGSTGSIGRSALDIVRRFPLRFKVVALSAGGTNEAMLAAQIKEFAPQFVAIADVHVAKRFAQEFPNISIEGGEQAVVRAAQHAEVVVAAISGVVGLKSTIAALKNGSVVALANKESIVCGAPIIASVLAANRQAAIIPVDSEHSSLAQLLLALPSAASAASNVSSLVLTASGGPFLNRPIESFSEITLAEAVKHPRWSMGAKISIDSSTLVNKALEWFEALYLFALPKVEIVIHPQSIVHACVNLHDGALLANMSLPDMTLPIGFAMGVAERLSGLTKPLSLTEVSTLTFMPVDERRFPAIAVARAALSLGAFGTCVYSLANEVAVESFCRSKIPYTAIVPFISKALSKLKPVPINDTEAIQELLREVRAL